MDKTVLGGDAARCDNGKAALCRRSVAMFRTLDIHEPLLINSIGHSMGLLLFAGFLILVLRDRRVHQRGQGYLPVVAATLALLWNAGSLTVLASSSGLIPSSNFAADFSFAVLSILPAVLLQLSLEGRLRPLWATGYAFSAIAVGLHLAELSWPDLRLHVAALWVIIVGFGLLSAVAMFIAGEEAPTRRKKTSRRIPVSMYLFLFAISFLHFSSGDVRHAWSSEIAVHHAGIPLALYVLLQDYRFLLLDAFLRFLVNSVVAFGFILVSLLLNTKFHILDRAAANPFLAGILLVAACGTLVLLVLVRGRLQVWLTRVAFHRKDWEPCIRAIREIGSKAESEGAFLEKTPGILAAFVGAPRSILRKIDGWEDRSLPSEPTLILEPGLPAITLAPGDAAMEACVPIRFLKGDGALILLGRREGGRRYLSEDLRELARLAAVVVELVERFRSSEIERLVLRAELKALQAQVNPHFLFNSLNTLYGMIPRGSEEARRMVLNLSDMFRYFLQSNRTLIPLSEEVELIRAYLQIEALRLGDRLRTEIVVDESAGKILIPILSIQPLIENAVKHGAAARSAPGTVVFSARMAGDGVEISVSDDGPGFRLAGDRKSQAGSGVGLDNVRQRLRLCFGEGALLTISSTAAGSTVGFKIPRNCPARSSLEGISA